MIRLLAAISLVAAIVASMPCYAASMLSDLLFSARELDPAFAIAKAQMQAAEQRTRQARAGLLPTLNFTGSATKSNFDEVDQQDRRFSTEQWALQLTQPLFRPANFAALTQAQRQFAQAEAQLAAAESDLAGRVATAWFEALAAQEVLHAVGAQKVATQQQLATAKRSFELGAVSIADVREVEAKHAMVVAQEAQAESDLAIKRETLLQLSGMAEVELDAKEWLNPQLGSQLGTLKSWHDAAQDSNPSVLQARLGVDAARLEINKAQAGHLPTVDLVLNHNFNRSSGTTSSGLHQHNKTTQYGVNVTVPLFAGFGTDAKVGEAIALQDKARGEHAQTGDQVDLSIKQAYFGLRGALAQIPAFETARAANGVSVQASQRGYQVGMRTNVDVLNAQAQFYQAEKDLAKAKLDAWMYYIRLRILTGKWTAEDMYAF